GCRLLTYSELHDRASRICRVLERHTPGGGPPLVGVFAYRSVPAFAGVLAALLRGHGYVPLNHTFPPSRTRWMLESAGCRAMIVDPESEKQLGQVLDGIRRPLLLILPERSEVAELARAWPVHTFVGAADLLSPVKVTPPQVPREAMAYLLFTSGST